MSGRGIKREAWVNFVYDYLDIELKRLSELGVRITSPIIMNMAVHAVNQEYCPVAEDAIHPVKTWMRRTFSST